MTRGVMTARATAAALAVADEVVTARLLHISGLLDAERFPHLAQLYQRVERGATRGRYPSTVSYLGTSYQVSAGMPSGLTIWSHVLGPILSTGPVILSLDGLVLGD